MKKLFTLLVAATAALSAMAQQHGPMNFVGNSVFYIPNLVDPVPASKDTVRVEMGTGGTASLTVPSLYYAAMRMTIPSFTIEGTAWTMDMKTMVSTWTEQEFTATAITATGEEKAVKGTLTAAYIHREGAFELKTTFSYGSMPFPVTYESKGYYTVDNAWGLVGRGRETNPYRIFDASDIALIADRISETNRGTGEYFVLMGDIDFGGSEAAPVQLPSIARAAVSSMQSVAYGFNGTFDGAGHAIRGIYHTANANTAEGKYNALFASLDTLGVVRNLVFDAENYVSAHSYVAPFASISKGTIENCTNRANITAAATFAAGICNYMVAGLGTVRTSANYGRIEAQTYGCGIVAGSQGAKAITTYAYLIDDCENHGEVLSTKGTGSAGIAGTYSGAITNCRNYGFVNDAAAAQYSAGIVSCLAYAARIDGCTNEGTILGGKKVGGIVGCFMKGDDASLSVTNCRNTGAVSGTANVGGIAGSTARNEGIITLVACTNTGAITSADALTVGNLRGDAAILIGEDCVIGAECEPKALDPSETAIATLRLDGTTAAAPAFDLQGRRTAATRGLQVRSGRVVLVR